MAKPPESTRTSLRQHLAARARERWPQLAGITIRWHGEFAYIAGQFPDGTTLPLMRLPDELTGATTRQDRAVSSRSSRRRQFTTWLEVVLQVPRALLQPGHHLRRRVSCGRGSPQWQPKRSL